MPADVCIVRTSVGNTASVCAAFARLNMKTQIVADANAVSGARMLVLPGVGAFGAGMSSLYERELVAPLRNHIESNKPTLAICLGLQLLCTSSTESPNVRGLGIIDAAVQRFEGVQPVPQIGWNEVVPPSDSRFLTRGYAYYSNSYRLTDAGPGWKVAYTDFGKPFVAAIERGPVLACQFHPELSGEWGLALIMRWVSAESGAA